MKKLMVFLTFVLAAGVSGCESEGTNKEYSMESRVFEKIKENPFVIEKEKVSKITSELEISAHELLRTLVPIAKKFAKPEISGYQVGVAALGESGNIYLGVNLEFADLPLNTTVHGEQFLVVVARNHGEQNLVTVAQSAAPCGHCRQFFHEMGVSDDLAILTPGAQDTKLASLLPESFGPGDLNLKATLMKPLEAASICMKSSIASLAIDAARASYAPYSLAKSGVAIQTKDGEVFKGEYLENAAFNPSLSPMQTALVALVAGMKQYSDISRVVLAEMKGSKVNQKPLTRHILESITQGVELELVDVSN
ncbi:MAG: Cytidine deaminase [Chlamydiia bacterium]|nr:Cytidine deaminase [Chlamydiia bacterium]